MTPSQSVSDSQSLMPEHFSLGTTPGMDGRLFNWHILDRLSNMNHQHPTSYNIKTLWCVCMWLPHSFLLVIEGMTQTQGVIPTQGK